MNTKNLKDIASVIAGYTFRKALKSDISGLMTVVQANNISDDLYVDNYNLTKINLKEYQTKAMIKENDIIISSRGSFRANLVKGDTNNMIATSSVYILRLNDKNLFSEYLTIYLNSIDGQRKIREKMTGSAIKTILRRDLENLKIPVPNKDAQNLIIALYKNNIAMQKILSRKKILINEIIESSIFNFLK